MDETQPRRESAPRGLRAGLAAVAVAALSACATPFDTLRAGQPVGEVTAAVGPPTGRYALPNGERLEYATGPYGRQTWMVDVDAQGRVQQVQQVLDEGRLMALQGRLPGMGADELRRTLGRPGEVRPGGWQGGEVWSWRYETYLCLWFQVSVGDDGVVRDGAFLPDPLCDVRDDGRIAMGAGGPPKL